MQAPPINQQQPQYVYIQQPQQQPSPGWKMAENVYEGSAGLGKIVGIFGAASGILIGVIVLVIGLFLILKKNTRIVSNATIKKADCKEVIQEVDNKRTVLQNCLLDVSYIASDNKTYEAKISTDGKKYIEGQTIKVSYDVSNPQDITLHTISKKTIGWISFVIGIFILGGSLFSLYLTLKYKAYQAAQGVGAVAGVINNAFD